MPLPPDRFLCQYSPSSHNFQVRFLIWPKHLPPPAPLKSVRWLQAPAEWAAVEKGGPPRS